MKTGIEHLLDQCEFRCVKCNALQGECDCWTQCPCGWSFEKGKQCRNPVHREPAT